MTAIPIEFEGRYKCPVCPRGYHTLADKKHHIKTKHPKKAKA